MNPFVDLLVCLRFFSRLPLPAAPADCDATNLASASALVPIAGAILGLVPASVLLAAHEVGLSATLASPLAICALVAVTGALHEDGLADCVDGFGGGQTRERKLEIMRDSRIGVFGVCALILSLYFRVAAVAVLAEHSPYLAGAALVAAASLSRTLSLLPLLLLPPARADGLGTAAGRPAMKPLAIAGFLALAIAFAMVPSDMSLARATTAFALAGIAALAVSALAWRQIGGQTGDVAGATQQVAEIAVLMVFA